MQILRALFFSIITLSTAFFLNIKIGDFPPIAKFLDPFHGFLALTGSDKLPLENLNFPELDDTVNVIWDERRIPHIFAQNDKDLFYVQGYITARDRLWQMEFQIMAAAGRLSEIIGKKALKYDLYQRRIGMVYAAENAFKAAKNRPELLNIIQSYSDGVNHYIKSLDWDKYPLEYKILDYKPELWSTIKTFQFLKYMALDLSGRSSDLDNTKILKKIGYSNMENLFPQFPQFIDPVIPLSRKWEKPSILRKKPDELYESNPWENSILTEKNERGLGSNNWAVSGSKSKSGFPMLANDPHLRLTLPNIWYEIHLNTPEFNVYGASLPGGPCIISGFNDYIAWGETNGNDDVWDWYDITFNSPKMEKYFYNEKWLNTTLRIEKIKIRGEPSYIDTVIYTHHGPIVWDYDGQTRRVHNYRRKGGEMVSVGRALRWLAHDESIESLTFYKLNKAKNYQDYVDALKHFTCPVQNFIYADVMGNIALWHAGNSPVKWNDQGRFIMDGTDPIYEWGPPIPHLEKAYSKNPKREFLSSANQHVTDENYPYYLGSWFVESYRGNRINQLLSNLDNAELEDFANIQMDTKNTLAEKILPHLISELDNYENIKYTSIIDIIKSWNYFSTANSKVPLIFDRWIKEFEKMVWADELGNLHEITWPDYERLAQLITKEKTSPWIDNILTNKKETFSELVNDSFKQTINSIINDFGPLSEKWNWGKSRGTDINHLANIPGLGRTMLETEGGSFIPNATNTTFGPSWRYVVEMTEPPKGMGIYPGGSSGFAGSIWYDNMIDGWVDGKMYEFYSSNNIDQIPGYKISFIGRKK